MIEIYLIPNLKHILINISPISNFIRQYPFILIIINHLLNTSRLNAIPAQLIRLDYINFIISHISFIRCFIVLSVFYSKKGQQVTGTTPTGDQATVQAAQVFDFKKELTCKDAIMRIKELSKERKFKESVEAIIRLSVDPRQGDQNIRGTCVLPAGTGKQIKVCVFADADMQEKVMEAGADVFGTDDLLKQLAEGKADFDKLIATQEQMQALKPLARVLGPKGLMPNVKSGTLVKAEELLETVRLSKQGQIEFRVNEHADIMVKIGLREFQEDQLFSNFDAFARALVKKKPESIKGKYFVRGYLKTSMGPPVKLDLSQYQKLTQE